MSRMNVIGWRLDRGSARRGAEQWWAQRVTALALLLLSLWFVISLLSIPVIQYATLREWMSRGRNAVPLGALVLVVAQHSYLGLRVVVEDYLHDPGTRIAILLLLRLVHALVAAAAVFAVFKVAIGALA